MHRGRLVLLLGHRQRLVELTGGAIGDDVEVVLVGDARDPVPRQVVPQRRDVRAWLAVLGGELADREEGAETALCLLLQLREMLRPEDERDRLGSVRRCGPEDLCAGNRGCVDPDVYLRV